MIYEKGIEILKQESGLLRQAADLQEKIRLSVVNREWQDFESYTKSMKEIEAAIETLEIERETLFNEAAPFAEHAQDSKGRFYAIVSRLPENQRNELTSIYRELKLDALKLRLANESFLTYLAGVKSIIGEFFSAAFPQRAGKIYSKNGTHQTGDMRSMVLNRSF